MFDDPLRPEENDGTEVLRTIVDTTDDLGPLRFEVAVWTRRYGPYLRYAFLVNRSIPVGDHTVGRFWRHPYSELDDTDIVDGLVSNIVADNEATRALLHLIALPDVGLRDHCGNRSIEPARYRAKLIRCIKLLWD